MSIEPAWRKPLAATALAILALLLLFARDARDMGSLWWNISTYQHCLYVLPIIAWLIWLRRGEVAQTTPAAWPPGLALVLGAALVWLIGEAGGVAIVRHIGLVGMIQASVIAILGPAVARAVLFPLFYLVFLVPFGDEFTGPMQTLTAKMTMGLLHLTGVPATIDGVFITTRAGWFEVAEACAGVKFLVAMVAYGALAANVCFRSPLRRTLFMIAAIVVPVLANGVRAWGTIYAAESIGVEAATGFDHIVYGWVFFAVVMLLIMGAAWPFFDRRIGENWLGGKVFPAWRPVAPVLLVAPLAVAAAAVPVVWDNWAARAGRMALPAPVDLPVVKGWTRVGDRPSPPWTPRFDGADHRLFGRYGNSAGQRVDVGVALYGWQSHGREIVAFGQGAADPSGHWAWAANLPPLAIGHVERIMGPEKAEREAATFWFVGGTAMQGRAAVKLATLKARLTGSDQSAATLIVSAQGKGAHDALVAFLHDMGDPQPRVAAMLAQAKGR
ncbi:exosortase A [Sphingomonas sp. SUN039]|uniref:exosortase A n=1 Tax=Sphingomonas sp. SUN039 TaxID=2937787 RepID=UPI0021648AD1|nr:exosortase A [Sphingomonas sp. SUN039]UVO53300.1 exosortase A [Sphingomonas sp. SUN039]